MLDRIDIHIEVPPVDYEKLSGDDWEKPAHPSVNLYKPPEIYQKEDL